MIKFKRKPLLILLVALCGNIIMCGQSYAVIIIEKYNEINSGEFQEVDGYQLSMASGISTVSVLPWRQTLSSGQWGSCMLSRLFAPWVCINSAGVILAGSATLYGEVNYCQGSHVEEPIQGLAGIRIGF